MVYCEHVVNHQGVTELSQDNGNCGEERHCNLNVALTWHYSLGLEAWKILIIKRVSIGVFACFF